MISYKFAKKEDARRIAQLHALSWQQNYKGILRDEYLDKEVRADRMQVWEKRLENPEDNQCIILAFDQEVLCGFACSFVNKDPDWGSLIDNLHVFGDWKGKGIGAELMRRSAAWIHSKAPDANLYLWVLEGNEGAIRFYRRMEGEIVETIEDQLPGGGKANIHRVVWESPARLIPAQSQ